MVIFLFLGILMGLANLVPGISGGTIAVISGKYDEIIELINSFISLKIKRKGLFKLIFLFIGALLAILIFSNIIGFLFENYKPIMLSVFTGLIFGGLIMLFKEFNIKSKNNLIIFIFTLIIFSLFFIFVKDSKTVENPGFLYLFAGGAVGAATMILPGISGSSMLLIMGIYEKIINAVSDMNFSVLIPTGLGIIFGLIFIVKLLKILLSKNKDAVFSFLSALTFSGIIEIFPYNSDIYVYFFIIPGFLLGFLLEKIFTK